MKSMKLASGFAVSALALAIAGTAAAQETTTEVEFTGSVKAQSVFDLENETRTNELPGSTSGDEDWYNLTATWTISHGPFSGDLIVGIEEDDSFAGNDTDGGGNGKVEVDNLIVEEGPVSFGQIGSIADTVGILEDLTDQDISAETSLEFGVDGGGRYTLSDLGVRVQAEGAASANANFGLAASVMQDLGVATVWADAQYREVEDTTNGGMADGETAFGAAVEASPVDMVTLTAVFRTKSDGNGGDGQAAWGAKADVMVSDTISAYGQAVNTNTDTEENTVALAGASMTVDALEVSGSYEANIASFADAVAKADVSYDAGIVVAYAESEFELGDQGTTTGTGVELTFGATHTTESGIAYTAEYMNRNEDHSDGVGSAFTVSGEYSF